MDVKKKSSEFMTSDGFRLIRDGRRMMWQTVGGDMEFEDYCGIPINSFGEPLDGDFFESQPAWKEKEDGKA